MTGIVCALLSAMGFYFSVGTGDQWWLAWFAPVPVLWFAFGEAKPWPVFFAAFAALALGLTNFLPAYAGVIPTPVLAMALTGPAVAFAVSVVAAQRVQRTLGDVPAMIAFAALWTMFDLLAAFGPAGGSVSTPAAAEVGAPILMQGASLLGFLGVTFLLGAVAAGLALTLRTRNPAPAAIAVALFALNAGYGYWRLSAPPQSTVRVALIESDHAVGRTQKINKDATLKAIDAYAAEIARLKDSHVQLIVLPENISRVAPEWRDEAEAKLAAVVPPGATLVAGFNTFVDGAQRNVSWAYVPGAKTPVTYEKRRLIPVLESAMYTPGPGPRVLANGTGLEICKDMDFQSMIRTDEVATQPLMLAVPAWDFQKDAWWHARIALIRSIENGVPMARTARNGLLILNDRYGRIVAETRTTGPFTTLIGALPLDGRGGNTFYDRIGDVFGWICAVVGIGLVALSFFKRKKAA